MNKTINIYNTSYTITGTDVDKVYNLLETVESRKDINNPYSHIPKVIYTDTLLKEVGLSHEDLSTNCRGGIVYGDISVNGSGRKLKIYGVSLDSLNEIIQKAIFEKFDVDIKYQEMGPQIDRNTVINCTTNIYPDGIYDISYYDDEELCGEKFRQDQGKDELVKYLRTLLKTDEDDLQGLFKLARKNIDNFTYIEYKFSDKYFVR